MKTIRSIVSIHKVNIKYVGLETMNFLLMPLSAGKYVITLVIKKGEKLLRRDN